MSGEEYHIALFDEVDPLAEAIEQLRKLGLQDDSMTVLSGHPHQPAALGRPLLKSNVPYIGMTGLLLGVGAAVLLVWGTPLQYPLEVGGQPLMPVPPLLVFVFELGMMGLLVATFLGVLWESNFPSFAPQVYHEKVSQGKTALVLKCSPELLEQSKEALQEMDVEWAESVEEKTL